MITAFEVSQVMLTKKIKMMTEFQALAYEQTKEGKPNAIFAQQITESSNRASRNYMGNKQLGDKFERACIKRSYKYC